MRWRDLRLWVGLGIMLAAMFGGALLLSRGETTTTVWQASTDLSTAAVAVGNPVTLSLGDTAAVYIPVSEPLVGRLRWPVPAGALIPRAALGESAIDDARLVTLPVDPLHAPVGLAPGDVVDLWSTPADVSTGAVAAPALVLAHVMIANVSAETVGIGGEIAVVVEVPADSADPVISASRSGMLDLVAVPIEDQVER